LSKPFAIFPEKISAGDVNIQGLEFELSVQCHMDSPVHWTVSALVDHKDNNSDGRLLNIRFLEVLTPLMIGDIVLDPEHLMEHGYDYVDDQVCERLANRCSLDIARITTGDVVLNLNTLDGMLSQRVPKRIWKQRVDGFGIEK